MGTGGYPEQPHQERASHTAQAIPAHGPVGSTARFRLLGGTINAYNYGIMVSDSKLQTPKNLFTCDRSWNYGDTTWPRELFPRFSAGHFDSG